MLIVREFIKFVEEIKRLLLLDKAIWFRVDNVGFVRTIYEISNIIKFFKMFDLEFYVWGILPMIIGLLILLKSIQVSLARKTILNWIILTIILLSSLLAEYILAIITFTDAWPSYFPHILLTFNLILLFAQIIIKNRLKTQNTASIRPKA